MDPFEQQFRDQWNNRQEPEFQEGDWEKLQGSLRGRNNRRWPGWLLLLPWLGIGGLLWLLLDLNRQLDVLQSNQAIPLAIVDTVLEVRERITHDTVHVYHTIVTRDTLFIQSSPMAWSESGPMSEPGLTARVSDRTGETSRSDRGETISSLPHSPFVPLNELEWRTLSMIPAELIEPVRKSTGETFKLAVEEMESQHRPNVNLLRKTFYHMRPDGLVISGGSDGLIPFGKGIRQGNGYSIGLNGAVRYGEHWQLGMGASYNQMSFEVHQFDASLGVPAVDPPGENFDFVVAEVIRPFLALDLEGRYTLPGDSRLSPFFEGGLRAILTRPYEVLYDFQDPDTGVTWTSESSPSGELKLPAQIILGAGLKYRLGSSWSLGLQGKYLHSLSDKNPIPHHVKVGGFLQYQF